jgi:hypothetical protein
MLSRCSRLKEYAGFTHAHCRWNGRLTKSFLLKTSTTGLQLAGSSWQLCPQGSEQLPPGCQYQNEINNYPTCRQWCAA